MVLVEQRKPPNAPLDVLLQHLTGLACGPGFHPDKTYAAVRSTASYADLNQDDWDWCMLFLEHGGECLGAYPRYRKLEWDEHPSAINVRDSRSHESAQAEHRNDHSRTSDHGAICPRCRARSCGRNLHQPAETEGCVLLLGRQLEFVRLRDMTAYVKVSTKKTRTVPAWAGGQMALSDLLTHHLRLEVDRASRGDLDTPELKALAPLFERQKDLSVLPRTDQLLIETCTTREGSHLYAYPFEGRFVHEGIGFLWASRLTRLERGTITVSVNDYGFELLAPRVTPWLS